MTNILDGQLSALDLLETVALDRPTAPPFMVNLSVWQPRACGWCKKSNTIGGAAIRHPEHHDISIFYEYCEKCWDKYGDPSRSDAWPGFLVNQDPGDDKPRRHIILERIATYRALTAAPPFIAHTYWPGIHYPCGFCGVRGSSRAPGVIGGYARLPNDDWITWRCCHNCVDKHGRPDPLNYPNLVVEHEPPNLKVNS